ncbi:MAG: DNA polymerase III subunit delta' [Actinomycetota bacterium]
MSTASDMWARLVGQQAAVRALGHALEQHATGRSFLFTGPRGVGREPAARALAASVLCEHGGCGGCSSCARVLRDAHADVVHVAPEGAQILVDQIREVRRTVARSPVEGRAKVIVLHEADALNPAAANAMLKILEEPPSDTLFILISERPEDLLETIRSRCRRIDFQPLTPDVIRSILAEQHGVNEQTSSWAARTGGDLATALRLAKDPDAKERRARHLDIPGRVVRGGLIECIRMAGELLDEAQAATAKLREEQDAEIVALAEMLGERRGSAGARKRLEGRHKRELKAREALVIDAALRDLTSFYRDCLLLAAGAVDEVLINSEEADRLRKTAGAIEPGWLLSAIDAVERSRRMLTRNTQPRLTLEALFAQLSTPRIIPR